ACGSAPEATGSVSSADVSHDTVVRFDAQGNMHVYQHDVPQAEVAAQIQERLSIRTGQASAVTRTSAGERVETVSSAQTAVDGSCNINDLWIYSADSCNGYRLCVAGQSMFVAFDLNQVAFPLGGSWGQNRVNAWWPGNETGAMWGQGTGWCGGSFSAWSPCITSPGGCQGGFARYVDLTD